MVWSNCAEAPVGPEQHCGGGVPSAIDTGDFILMMEGGVVFNFFQLIQARVEFILMMSDSRAGYSLLEAFEVFAGCRFAAAGGESVSEARYSPVPASTSWGEPASVIPS